MKRRLAATAALFTLATLATVALARWLPPHLQAPAAAGIVATLGALLIGLAPSQGRVSAVASDAPVAAPTVTTPTVSLESFVVPQLAAAPPLEPANHPEGA